LSNLGCALKFLFEMVAKKWASISHGAPLFDVWHNKIRHLRLFLRDWAKNRSNFYKKAKQRHLDIIDSLDIKAETVPLDVSKRDKMRDANEKLANLHRDEEAK
jgi:hypothetical protein